MVEKLRPHLTYANVGVTIALVLATTGATIAAIPGSDGVIKACYHKKSGALRVIDSKKRCKKKEKTLTWNQKGVQGETGPTGQPGAPGSDAQFNGATAGGDLTGAYPDPQIGPNAVGDAEIGPLSVGSTELKSGAVTTTKFGTIPAVRAQDASQTIQPNVITSIAFTTEDLDTTEGGFLAGMHSNTSNTTRFTASADGVYQVHVSGKWETGGDGTTRAFRVTKNGPDVSGAVALHAPAAADIGPQHISALVDLSSGDYLEMTAFHNSTTAKDLTLTTFDMFWVGPQ